MQGVHNERHPRGELRGTPIHLRCEIASSPNIGIASKCFPCKTIHDSSSAAESGERTGVKR